MAKNWKKITRTYAMPLAATVIAVWFFWNFREEGSVWFIFLIVFIAASQWSLFLKGEKKV